MNRLLALLALCTLALAAAPAQAQYALRANVVASGATDATGGSVRLRATVGQPAVGRVAGGSAAVGQGFWYPATLAGGGGGPALSVTATPLNPPIVIPAGGGMFRFRVTIQNNTAQTQTFQAWINVTLPNGSTYHVQGPQSLTLGPNATFGPVTLQQQIPDWAPAGTYTHNVRVGTYPSGAVATGSFPWTKSATPLGPGGDVLALDAREAPPAARRERAAARPGTTGRSEGARRAGSARIADAREEAWRLLMAVTGEPVGEGGDLALAMPVDEVAEARITAEEAAREEAARAAAEEDGADQGDDVGLEEAAVDVAEPAQTAASTAPPVAATLAPPFPNPGARMTLRFGLPEAGPARLAVYDVQGRRVALLVDETRAAGWHEVPFLGAGLAGGVYLVRLEADGRVQTQRLTLLR